MSPLPLQDVQALEKLRDSHVMVFWSADSHPKYIDPKDLTLFYQCLRRFSPPKRIDLILHTEGGLISAARRLALLLREFTTEVSILIPHKARSAGTLLCLAADNLVLGPLAELSPLDPIIGKEGSPSGLPQMVSSEDIRAFQTLAKTWFGLRSGEHQLHVFDLLNQHFFPTSLSRLFRADRYVRQIGVELLHHQLPQATLKEREQIVDKLVSHYSEHLHSFTRAEVRQLGLNARAASPDEERLLWNVWQGCCDYMKAPIATGENSGSMANAILFSQDFGAHHVIRPFAPVSVKMAEGEKPPASDRAVSPVGWQIFR